MERQQGSQEGKDVRRPIRRVRSPSRPRGWFSASHKPKFVGHFYKPRSWRDERSFYKPGFGGQRPHPLNPRSYFQRREHFHSKHHPFALTERERERLRPKEKERYEPRESPQDPSPCKQTSAPRPSSSRSTSSRDKDLQFTVDQSDRSQSRERDHRGERSREGESTVSQTAARDRAIQHKRREIDQVYSQECEMFGLVTKMLIAKDPSLEEPIQSSLQENLRDIGKRCVEAMEKFIQDYDARAQTH